MKEQSICIKMISQRENAIHLVKMKTFHFLLAFLGTLLVSSDPLNPYKRLIKTSAKDPPKWMAERDIWSVLIRKNKPFIDVTDHQDIFDLPPSKGLIRDFPTEMQYQNETRYVFNSIDDQRVKDFVKQFSSYHTRYYKGSTGIQSQAWLLEQIQETSKKFKTNSISVREFEHSWPQKSIIARIEGSDPELRDEVIIFGAHQDSINIWGGRFRAPGADDNAAGSVTVLECLRALGDSGIKLKRSLEFHWYAAEEVGLKGSQAIAQSYKRSGTKVVAMINFDVPGYQAEGINDIGIYTDNTSPELNQFLRIVVDEYLDYGKRDCECGYGCSDHASWTNYQFPAAFPAEVKWHPQMHTTGDNYERIGFTQIREFVKLGLASIVEFGEPASA